MGTFGSMDTEELRTIAGLFADNATTMSDLLELIQTNIDSLPEAWAGDDAQHFVDCFGELKPGLESTVTLIDSISQTLTKVADDEDANRSSRISGITVQ